MHIPFRVAVFVLLVGILLCPDVAQAQGTPMTPSVALQYFQEAQAATERDDGKLWGIPVCGPLLFVDPKTRQVIANQSDHLGLLARKDEVYIGRVADDVPIANHAVKWGEVQWAMIVWPFLTNDKFQRVRLMAHESFHRIQNTLLLTAARTNNDHLDSEEGRIWLQLEWRALQQALTSKGTARRRTVEDALTFRAYRRTLFPQSASSERASETSEGLAEYTGFRLSAKDNTELLARLTKAMETEAARPKFMSSFAYSSGPAYGYLLDMSAPQWRKGWTPIQDLGEALQDALKIKLALDLKATAEKQASQYGGEALRLAEANREEKRQDQIAEERKRFLASPTLLVPLSDKRTITVTSNAAIPMEGAGTVYPTSLIRDEWGTLEVTRGALMIQNEKGRVLQVYLTLPNDLKARPLNGDGWILKLAPGWSILPGSREGDFLLKRLEP